MATSALGLPQHSTKPYECYTTQLHNTEKQRWASKASNIKITPYNEIQWTLQPQNAERLHIHKTTPHKWPHTTNDIFVCFPWPDWPYNNKGH